MRASDVGIAGQFGECSKHDVTRVHDARTECRIKVGREFILIEDVNAS
jgi:hypothetical protein